MKHSLQTKLSLTTILLLITVIIITCNSVIEAAESTPGFFRYPHTDGENIVFTSEGDLWKVPLKGGTAVRLTTHKGEERFPKFSPDGKWIAFSGQDDGQDDVYVIPASGGEPRRLTFHPGRDQVIGWDKENNVLFRSSRETSYRIYKIFKVSTDGGLPESIGLDKGTLISYEPEGSRIAFNRFSREFRTWKRYKGGWAQDIWVGDIDKLVFKNITDNPPQNDWDGTDAFPMWHTNGRIYFNSDRNGRSNIYSMTPEGLELKQHTEHSEFDIRWPSLGNGVIVYQNGMDIYTYYIDSNQSEMVKIKLPSDRVQAREKIIDPKKYITDFKISPDGKRVLFCARGELFTVPSKGKGLIRQLTFTSGVRDKYPNWSPDGEKIAAWSDITGEELLYLYPAKGGDPVKIGGDERGWHYPAEWSPDGEKLVFSNEELELVVLDAKSGKRKVIDRGEWEIREYCWSPDSRYLAYTFPEENYNQTVCIWDSKIDQPYRVTKDFFNSYSPCFDPEGKYLYFMSDRVANPHLDGQEMTYILDRRTRPYCMSLKKDMLSPFAPEADPDKDEDENEWDFDKKKKKGKKKGKKDDEEEKEPVKVEIDFKEIKDRIAPFPVPAGNFGNLKAVKNKIFYISWQNSGMFGDTFEGKRKRGVKLHKYNIKRDKKKIVAEVIQGYDISADGEHLLIRKEGRFEVSGIDEGFGGGFDWKEKNGDEEEDDKNVDLSGWDLRVDIRAEWHQMFNEAWRTQRDFFWDPNLHEVDWEAVRKQYLPLAARISTRDELNDLIGEMFAELNCSHAYVGGGDQRRADWRGTGLLGVDVTRHKSGFYRIDRIIEGRRWVPNLSSPFITNGDLAKVGDYIVAINGRSTAEVSNYLELLRDKAGEIVSVVINGSPSLEGGKEVIVKPMGSESALRYYDWVDNRRAYVEEKTDGKIGYIHLANMGGMGLSQFSADYLPQHNKKALILDVRYNGGGFVAPMILSHLARDMFAQGRPRHGSPYRTPSTAFYGHMAAVCNGETGSDGETFTEGFRRLGLGPIFGTRTWGGWVGIRGGKPLLDRGGITQPEFTGWGEEGKWLIEGHGTDPDSVIVDNPADVISGKDAQLDATIDYLLKKIKDDPMNWPKQPEYPNRR
ncbi:MAG: PDZ domain-containing protein [Candidatus Hatepunaea meridiana]|nr:PDZ domain-containing protein [Candidatus Hatepunaea meridiana]